MIKKGFTLQELLITMAIIGIVSAITVPAIQKIIPNEQKLKYMKAYNAVTSITNDIAGDSSLYWTEYNDSGNATCLGMGCINTMPNSYNRLIQNTEVKSMMDRLNMTFGRWNSANGAMCKAKFAILFASKLNLISNPVCNISPGFSGDVASCTFTTTDGYQWTIVTNIDASNSIKATHTITVDTNNNGSSTNTAAGFNNGTPKNIDTFTFDISNEGNVSIPDPEYLAKEFLKNPTEMHDATKEFKAAKAAYNAKKPGESTLNTDPIGIEDKKPLTNKDKLGI